MKYQGLIGFALGSLAGAFSAYFILKKRFETELEAEIEDVKKVYSKSELNFHTEDTKTYSAAEKGFNGFTSSSLKEGEELSKAIDNAVSTYIPKECLPSKEEEEKVLTMLNPSEDPDIPYLISDDTYVDTKPNYTKETLHYYAGDEVIADEDLEAIIHPEMMVGDMIPEYFDNLLRTEHYADAIYIRNDNQSRDFEIIYHEDKFFCD